MKTIKAFWGSPGVLAMIFLLGVLILIIPPGCEADSNDSDARDSAALHVLAGASSALLISAISYPLVDMENDRRSALLVAGLGLSGSLIAGATKELLDLRGFGHPEWTDLLLTLGGGILAASLVYTLTFLQPNDGNESAGIAAVYGAFALILSLPVGTNLLQRVILSSQPRS